MPQVMRLALVLELDRGLTNCGRSRSQIDVRLVRHDYFRCYEIDRWTENKE